MIDDIPAIGLTAHDRITDIQLAQVLLGLEEEGVPWTLTRSEEMNPLTLAHQAAVSSRLGIGIGISLDYVVITTEKLPPQRPYLAHFLNYSPETDRIIGSNAARLVKRVPLRTVVTERSQ